MKIIGQGMDRTDGRLKVTGGAVYSAEHAVPRLAQAVMVQSTIPSGRIVEIDDAAARAMPGVLLVMTHLNAPPTTLLQENCVQYNGQPVAVVVADTLEHAQDAARHLRLRYAAKPAVLSFRQAKANLRKPAGQTDSSRGNVADAMRQAAATIDARARRGNRQLRARVRTRRTGVCAECRSDSIASAKLCRTRSRQGFAMV